MRFLLLFFLVSSPLSASTRWMVDFNESLSRNLWLKSSREYSGKRRFFLAHPSLAKRWGLINSSAEATYNGFLNTIEIKEEYFQIIELDEKGSMNLNLEGIQLDYTKVYHKPESLAYRLTDKAGFSVVYSGDTDFCEPLIDLSRKTDILICESAFPDGKKVSGHLTPSIAGEIAAKARVRKLVLTHFYPVCDDFDIKAQCRNTFTGPLVLAEDLLNL
ncbi:MAG: hypothetical protein HN580_17300 [Deltaproteobacteria bacterium]|nr:hypothetical protein [Deltaproteobacteria bacterium]